MGKRNLSKYDPSDIKVLKGLEGVRKRPAMYIGDTDQGGFHHLLYEVVDNSLDEAVAGFCDKMRVAVSRDGVVTVEDNGRGIPVKNHPVEKVPTVDVVMTILHAGGKFGGSDSKYRTSGGLHGVGVSVVNALSEWLEVTVKRHGKKWHRRYECGIPTKKKLDVVDSGLSRKETGTCVRFVPDGEIFKGNVEFSRGTVVRRLRELAFLNPGLEITLDWEDDEGEESEVFESTGGLVEYVRYLANGKTLLHSPVSMESKDVVGCEAELAFVYDSAYEGAVVSFANNINTAEGGVHQEAALYSLCQAITGVAESKGMLKGLDFTPNKSDIAEGLTMVVSVRVPEPQFGGQTKTRLTNADLRVAFGEWMQKSMERALASDKALALEIASKIVDAMKSRDAAKKAKNLSRRKSVLASLTLPGKLADCTSKDPQLCELAIVEGNSAGGSAIEARDRQFQAVLPLRGKILNVTRTTLNKALENKELGTLISALGVTVTPREVLLDDLRYHKVVLMADADPDGSHIICLLLAFFYKHMRRLIEEGHLYVCDLPLYRVTLRGKSQYLKDDKALEDFRRQYKGQKIEVSRFKGLGEMDADELAETAMNPKTRRIKRVHIEDEREASRMLECLMGGDIAGRKQFLSKALRFENMV